MGTKIFVGLGNMASKKLSNLLPCFACNDLGLALPMHAKATWGIRLPHGDYIGQLASPCSDMFVQLLILTEFKNPYTTKDVYTLFVTTICVVTYFVLYLR